MPRREKPIPRSQRISFNRGTKVSRNSPGAKDSPTNHSPYFYVDDSALTNGLKAFVNLVEDVSNDYNTINY